MVAPPYFPPTTFDAAAAEAVVKSDDALWFLCFGQVGCTYPYGLLLRGLLLLTCSSLKLGGLSLNLDPLQRRKHMSLVWILVVALLILLVLGAARSL